MHARSRTPRTIFWLLLVALLCTGILQSRTAATVDYARATGQPCSTCHVRPEGGGELKAMGIAYARGGYQWPVVEQVQAYTPSNFARVLKMIAGYVHLAVAVIWFRYGELEPRLKPSPAWDALLWVSAAGFLAVGLWTAAAAIWTVATISAFSAFPPPLASSTSAATERLFVEARDAYLRRDWIAAETNLGALLAMRPTDGEAQLLLATLLRRLGRENEARRALERLARSDSGLRWQAEIAREQTLLDRGTTAAADGADEADSDADRLRPAA